MNTIGKYGMVRSKNNLFPAVALQNRLKVVLNFLLCLIGTAICRTRQLIFMKPPLGVDNDEHQRITQLTGKWPRTAIIRYKYVISVKLSLNIFLLPTDCVKSLFT